MLEQLKAVPWGALTCVTRAGTTPYYYKYCDTPDGGYLVAFTDASRTWFAQADAAGITAQLVRECPAVEMGSIELRRLLRRCLDGGQSGTAVTLEKTAATDDSSSSTLKVWVRTSLAVSRSSALTLTWTLQCTAVDGEEDQKRVRHEHIIGPLAATVHALALQVSLYREAILAKDREINAIVDGTAPPRRITPVFVPDKFENEFLASKELHTLVSSPSIATSGNRLLESVLRVYAGAPASAAAAAVGVVAAPQSLPVAGSVPPSSSYVDESLPEAFPTNAVVGPRPSSPAKQPGTTTTAVSNNNNSPMLGRYTSYIETAEDRARRLKVESVVSASNSNKKGVPKAGTASTSGPSVPPAKREREERALPSSSSKPSTATTSGGPASDHVKKVKKALM
eukprot:PhM_4_TR9352/c0_g1_i1/m.72623/K10980/NHEJ1, XLF; non-homologous end-joining factor 1